MLTLQKNKASSSTAPRASSDSGNTIIDTINIFVSIITIIIITTIISIDSIMNLTHRPF